MLTALTVVALAITWPKIYTMNTCNLLFRTVHSNRTEIFPSSAATVMMVISQLNITQGPQDIIAGLG